MDQNNKAVMVIRFFCQYAMKKAVEDWIDVLPGGKFAYMAYELGKGVYEILSNTEMMDRDAILEAATQLSDADIQLIAQELSNQQAYRIAIQETLQTIQGLSNRFRGQPYIQTEGLRQQINQTLLSGRQQIPPQSFNAQQQTIGAQVAHALTVRSATEQDALNQQFLFNPSQVPQIQGFALKAILGKGTYATVYLAVDLRKPPYQICALKIGQIDEIIRFEREVKNMKAIKHPNVLTCLDAGTIKYKGSSYYWISMENMRPITVQDLMRDFNASHHLRGINHHQESKWVLLEEIALGLSALHSAGILHRDLKPANCFISEQLEVKLSDFGLSKNLSQHAKDHTINSSQQYQLGTPAYMSPEQIQGENVGLASDVWSFGVMAYEMFTGELPFQKANNPAVLMANILKDQVVLDAIKGKVDQQLIDFIRKCLEKDVQKRYANGMEMAKTFVALSQAEQQKIKDDRFQTVWQKVIDQGLIEQYVMDCVRGGKVQAMGVDDWKIRYPQIIFDFKRLGEILEKIKDMALREEWEKIMGVDLNIQQKIDLERLEGEILRKREVENEEIKKRLGRYSQDEWLDKAEEIAWMKKEAKDQLDLWEKEARKALGDRYFQLGQRKGEIDEKIRGAISGSSVSVKKKVNSQGIQMEERVLSILQERIKEEVWVEVPMEKIVEKSVNVEVVKKGWFWDSKAIEEKVVQEKVVEIVKKKEIREKIMESKVGFNMLYCPTGEFWMESTTHKVKITKSFWMGETQVTQELWQAVIGWNPSHFKGSSKLPVENITWYDSLVFCNKLSELEKFTPCFNLTNIEKDGNSIKKANVEWLRNANGYRLPTEAEWEYSAKAGTELIYSGLNSIDEVAWYRDNSGLKTYEVKGKKANVWGLYDMSGNVWEWCMDQLSYNPYNSRKNGIENPILWSNSPCARVARGGSCRNRATDCRVAYRPGFVAGHRYDYRGFRLLRCEP